MKFEYIGDGIIQVIDKSGQITTIAVDEVSADQWASMFADYYRMGFVDGVNIMAEAAKGVCGRKRTSGEGNIVPEAYL